MALNPTIDDWRGKVAWVVGASSGIGRATASALHRRGANVVVSARDAAALQDFVDLHPGAMALVLDVTDAAAVANAGATLFSRFGGIDMVFACVGYYKPQRATAFDLAEMKRHHEVNVVGVMHLLDAVLPRLLAGGRGHVSLMGSVAGYRGLPHALAYGPTKAALINLAEVLYLDLHDRGLGVSIVNPGFVDTRLTAQNRFRMPALITAEEAAEQIVAGWERGRFEIHFPRRFTFGLKALQKVWHGLYFAAVRRGTGL